MNVTSRPTTITADCIVQGVIERHPQIIAVFTRNRMQCVGCYIAPFHTIADSAREHAISLEALLDDLNRALLGMNVATQQAAW
jgi:hybrid cluster-associated redox disulfide protein